MKKCTCFKGKCISGYLEFFRFRVANKIVAQSKDNIPQNAGIIFFIDKKPNIIVNTLSTSITIFNFFMAFSPQSDVKNEYMCHMNRSSVTLMIGVYSGGNYPPISRNKSRSSGVLCCFYS